MQREEPDCLEKMHTSIADAYDQARRYNITTDMLNATSRQVEEVVAGFSSWGISEDLADELGSVTVNGEGDLVKIRLGSSVTGRANLARLGGAVVAALSEAEKKASAVRLRRIKIAMNETREY